MTDLGDPASYTPADSPMTIADIVASPEYLDLMAPDLAAGDEAADFELVQLDRPDERARLRDFAGNQPVALIFGSYT
jgi:hypothetical protein